LSHRLDSFIASQTEWSRRKVQDFINERLVKVNDKFVHDISREIDPKRDVVKVKGRVISAQVELFYFKFNKPKNVLSTLVDPKGRLCVGDFYHKIPKSVVPVGRLDRKSTGLMIFTNDGELSNRILHPRYSLRKVYRVGLNEPISRKHLDRLRTGVFLEDGPVVVDSMEVESPTQLVLSISIGRNRIIRRLFAFLGYDVVILKRISIGPIELGKCPEGEFKDLTKSELKSIISILN